MSLFDLFKRRPDASAQPGVRAQLNPAGQAFTGLDDADLDEYMRTGMGGLAVDPMRNMAVLRCVSLICESIGMLPLNLIYNDETKAPATDHPVYKLLKYKPNTWQTPYDFKSSMQLQALQYGNAYAQVVRSAGRVIGLVPLFSVMVWPRLDRNTLKMTYEVTERNGKAYTLQANEVLHLRDLSLDGIRGLSRMALAKEAIEFARNADKASANVFKTGNLSGGAIETPAALSDQAYKRMQDSLASGYTGVDNINKWMLLEEGAKANAFGQKAVDAQLIQQRNQQIQEIARAFGVPRPLLMMDDTSWGSGIEQLGIFFVQYGLQHWLTAWEQAVIRATLTDYEMGTLTVKFNERALLRGTFADQAAYFSKALGSGGSAPWMTPNEVRDLSELPESTDETADSLRNPMTQKGTTNVPAQAA